MSNLSPMELASTEYNNHIMEILKETTIILNYKIKEYIETLPVSDDLKHTIQLSKKSITHTTQFEGDSIIELSIEGYKKTNLSKKLEGSNCPIVYFFDRGTGMIGMGYHAWTFVKNSDVYKVAGIYNQEYPDIIYTSMANVYGTIDERDKARNTFIKTIE